MADANIPAAARAHTDAGAEVFVRYFIKRWNVAWTTPKAGILFPLCQPLSKACAGYEAEAARLAKAGYRYDGDPVTIKFVGVLELDNPNPKQIDVLANVVQERRSQIDTAGKIHVTDQRKDFRIHFELVSTGQGWLVTTIELMQ